MLFSLNRIKYLTALIYLSVGTSHLGAQISQDFFYKPSANDPKILEDFLKVGSYRQILDLSGIWKVEEQPSDLSVIVPAGYAAAASVVFSKTFIPDSTFRKMKFRLISFGMNKEAKVYINDKYLTSFNQGGYIPFALNIDDGLIKVGEKNTIKIHVDNRYDLNSSIPSEYRLLQQQVYGGIFREIFLLAIPPINIESYRINYTIPDNFNHAEFDIRFDLRNSDFNYEFTDTLNKIGIVESKKEIKYVIEIFSQDQAEPVYSNTYTRFPWGAKKLNTGNVIELERFESLAKRIILTRPVLWSPLNPYQYKVRISISEEDRIIDEVEEWIGLRAIGTKNGHVFLNGAPIKIQGIEYYEDFKDHGNAIPYAIYEEDIKRLKKLGVNTIHVQFFPPHPYFVELCNIYGLMVISEIPLFGLSSKVLGSQFNREIIRNYVNSYIDSYKRNASIISWGVGKALNLEADEISNSVRGLIDAIRAQDSRPIHYNLYFHEDISRLDVDIVNLETFTNTLETTQAYVRSEVPKYTGQVILCSYGTQIDPHNQSGYSDPNSVHYQGKYLADVFNKLDDWGVSGGIIRSYNDFEVNRTYIYSMPQNKGNIFTTGIVDNSREERFGYEVVNKLYNNQRGSVLIVGSYQAVYPKVFPITGLAIVALFVSFYRQNPKFSHYVLRSFNKLFSFYSDIRENRVIVTWPAVVVALLGSMALATMLGAISFELRNNQVFDEFLSAFLATDKLKSLFDFLTWRPTYFILYFSAFFFLVFSAVSVFIRVFGLILRTPITFHQSLIAAGWSTSPFLILIPALVIFHRLLAFDTIFTISIVLICWLFVWYAIRLIKIYKVLYQLTWQRTATLFGTLFGGSILILIVFLHYELMLFEHLDYVLKIFESGNYLTR